MMSLDMIVVMMQTAVLVFVILGAMTAFLLMIRLARYITGRVEAKAKAKLVMAAKVRYNKNDNYWPCKWR